MNSRACTYVRADLVLVTQRPIAMVQSYVRSEMVYVLKVARFGPKLAVPSFLGKPWSNIRVESKNLQYRRNGTGNRQRFRSTSLHVLNKKYRAHI